MGKGNYFFKSGALFHREKMADQWAEQLMLPQTRRRQVMYFAHRTLTDGHCRSQRTEPELSYISLGLVFVKMSSILFLSVKTVIFVWVLEGVIMYQLLRL